VRLRCPAEIIERDGAGLSQEESHRDGAGGRNGGQDSRQIQIGAANPSLTAMGGMVAVTELCGRLGLIVALDEGIGPVKQWARGLTGGQVLTGMAHVR
jgi:hypothetical protein